MKFTKLVRSVKGFSLVELMIVVAIIGILSAVAIPNFSRFQRKARQSEVKNNLSSYYTTELSYSAENNIYAGNFSVTGFNPVGTLNYRIDVGQNTQAGNQASGAVTSAPGYVAGCTSTAACGAIVEMAVGSLLITGVSTNTAAPAAATATSFTANSGGFIGGAADDLWNITQTKALTNSQSGL